MFTLGTDEQTNQQNMKTNYKYLMAAVAFLFLLGGKATAQVASYSFAQSSENYVHITGGTVIAVPVANTTTGNLSNTVWNMPNGTIPFPFMFNGQTYTGFNISNNGYITFGTIPPTNTGNAISVNTAYDGAIVAWGRTTNGVYQFGTAPNLYTSEVRVEVIGTAPNRTLVVQWDKWRYSSGTTATSWLHDYQIRLVETSNVIEIAYGPGYMAGGSLTTSGFNMQVGLRGANNLDFNNRSSFGLFDQSTPGTANNASQVIGVTSGVGIFMPPSGLVYRWYPPCSMITPVTPTIAATSTLLCEGDTLNFSGIGETPYFDMAYQWQVSPFPGGPYTDVTGTAPSTLATSYVSPATPGMFYYVLSTNCLSGSNPIVSNEIAVDVRPLPQISILSMPIVPTTTMPVQVCENDTYTLTAAGADTYTWVNGPSTDSFVIQPAGTPIYTVQATSSDGCVNSQTIEFLVHPLPVISMLASPDSVCPGKPVVVGATGNAMHYAWVGLNTFSFMITVAPEETTTYSVVGMATTGCTNMATKEVAVYPVNQLSVNASRTSGAMCVGEPLTLTGEGADMYEWTAPGIYTVGASVVVSPASSSIFTLTGTTLKGCQTSTTLVMEVNECVGLGQFGEGARVEVYPNPGTGFFTVDLNNGAVKTFQVMDVTGKVVYAGQSEQDRTQLDISHLSRGIYYLQLQSNNAVQVIKLIKE